MKKIVVAGLAVCLSMFSAVPVQAAEPVTHGRAAVLIDGQTGQILFQQNAQTKNFPASTTKILTALVAVEHGNLDQLVKVTPQAVDLPWDSSSCYLEKGEEQRFEHLLYGLLLVSGNDCATAIAEGASGGNQPQFISWMNETAKRLGANNSHFTNSHGLHDANHYTTALDLALIARGAFTNPTVARISTTKEFNWPGKERNGVYMNHNPLLGLYDGIIGGKTGFTEEAGMTLVESAVQNGRLLIGVVMGEENRLNEVNDMTTLLDFGFKQFEQRPAVSVGKSFGEANVAQGQAKNVVAVAKGDFLVSSLKGSEPTVTTKAKLKTGLTAPIVKGEALGTLEVFEGERMLGSVPLVAANGVQAAAINVSAVTQIALTVLGWLGISFLFLICFRFIVRVIRRSRRRSRRSGGDFRRRPAGSSAMLRSYRSR